ncbi:hypothetical protein Taro_023881 [Colocasia esculenta]|uniref:Mediator of RNA polymerase II transcription subunit 17 n=1 Tax=Colocasia esculenta TaxID=4460 RepID=A0A843V5X0_COLES|nr:hypothetical protein [Colocasia esculenta]
MAEEDMKIHIDRLPLKRVEAIDDAGLESFPAEIGADEKRLDLIRRIDFSWVVEKDSKKPKKKSSKEEAAAAPWPWQALVENLQLAHQELSVIIDLINTVEANDAVAVAGMTRPKQLPNELLSDLAVSTATKLQHLRHLGRYFRQSSKALEKQVTREARFYGALIRCVYVVVKFLYACQVLPMVFHRHVLLQAHRLQQNWKIKRQRPSAPGNEGFTIDLHDSLLSDSTVISRPSLLSTAHVDHDPAGMLALQLLPKSCRFIHFGFVGEDTKCRTGTTSTIRKQHRQVEHPSKETKGEPLSEEDVNESVKETHSVLREIHQAIFEEQVFDVVNRETFYSSSGVNVTGMREDFLQLGIGQEASVYLCLESAQEGGTQTSCSDGTRTGEFGASHCDSLDLMIVDANQDKVKRDMMKFPNPLCFEIYLQSILHENVFVRAKGRHSSVTKTQSSGQSVGEGLGLLGHFCMTIAHRVFSKKVLANLENLVEGIPYLQLLSHPTWHSRTSSWSLTVKVPLSTIHSSEQAKHLNLKGSKSEVKQQFHTRVVVNDECISINAEGTPSIISTFNRNAIDTSSLNCYSCDIADLPVILLQQVT